MKRADPSTFPEKFKKHAVTPSRSVYVSRESCEACALGIEAIDASSLFDAWIAGGLEGQIRGLSRLAGLSRAYAGGLDDGWQGRRAKYLFFSDGSTAEYAEYVAGHADGKAAYKACIEAGLVPPLAP